MVTPAAMLSDANIRAIRQLVAEGKLDEAVRCYRTELACEEREAIAAVHGLFERDVFYGVLAKQLIMGRAAVITLFCFVTLCGSIVLAVETHGLARIVAIALFGISLLIFPFRRLRLTLRYLGAEHGTAIVRKLVWLGEVKGPWGPIQCAKAWVDIRAKRGAISTSMDIVTLTKPRFFEGAQLDVKFFHADPSTVLLAHAPPPIV